MSKQEQLAKQYFDQLDSDFDILIDGYLCGEVPHDEMLNLVKIISLFFVKMANTCTGTNSELSKVISSQAEKLLKTLSDFLETR